jgi:hypothetical protein
LQYDYAQQTSGISAFDPAFDRGWTKWRWVILSQLVSAIAAWIVVSKPKHIRQLNNDISCCHV